jgi:enoyl-CoA hydratase/carnithine racemase
MPDDILLVEVTDRIAVVTLNRPAARNALSRDLIDTLIEAVHACDADETVDAVTIPARPRALRRPDSHNWRRPVGRATAAARRP